MDSAGSAPAVRIRNPPRSAASAIGIGFEAREQEKLLCLTRVAEPNDPAAEATSLSEPSAPEFVQEDVEMEVETPQTIPVIDVCLCSERVRIGCLTSPDLLSEERFSVESISFQVELMTLKLWSFVDPKFAVEANRSSFGYHT